MPSIEQTGRVYQDLANWYDQRHDVPMRDRFLVMTADALLSAGRRKEAEALRRRLLQLNPNHLVQPFASMAEAAKSRDVRDYVDGLRRSYPPQAAEQLLASLRGESDEHQSSNSTAAPAPTASQNSTWRLPPLEPTSVRPAPAASKVRPESTAPTTPARAATRGTPSWTKPRPNSWRNGWSRRTKPTRSPARGFAPRCLR